MLQPPLLPGDSLLPAGLGSLPPWLPMAAAPEVTLVKRQQHHQQVPAPAASCTVTLPSHSCHSDGVVQREQQFSLCCFCDGTAASPHCPLSLVSPSLLPPKGIVGMVWLRLLASCVPGSRGLECQSPGKHLCFSHQQREMVSDATSLPRAWGGLWLCWCS